MAVMAGCVCSGCGVITNRRLCMACRLKKRLGMPLPNDRIHESQSEIDICLRCTLEGCTPKTGDCLLLEDRLCI